MFHSCCFCFFLTFYLFPIKSICSHFRVPQFRKTCQEHKRVLELFSTQKQFIRRTFCIMAAQSRRHSPVYVPFPFSESDGEEQPNSNTVSNKSFFTQVFFSQPRAPLVDWRLTSALQSTDKRTSSSEELQTLQSINRSFKVSDFYYNTTHRYVTPTLVDIASSPVLRARFLQEQIHFRVGESTHSDQCKSDQLKTICGTAVGQQQKTMLSNQHSVPFYWYAAENHMRTFCVLHRQRLGLFLD